ncbi:MAG: FMN-binding protein [Gemmiger sp.]|nr:FMN-binding protein [Gemmiger sp.]
MANNPSAEKQSASKELVFPVVVLVVICLVCSAILAVLNNITAPIIEANTRAETLAAYVSVLPQGTTTDELTEVENLTTANVSGAVRTAAGDVAVKSAATGYSGKDVTVYVAFDADGAISGISIDASTQTTGIGSKVGEERFASGFMGWNSGKVSAGSPVDSVSGATYSTNAVYNAVNAAIDCYNNEIKGGM